LNIIWPGLGTRQIMVNTITGEGAVFPIVIETWRGLFVIALASTFAMMLVASLFAVLIGVWHGLSKSEPKPVRVQSVGWFSEER